MTLPSLFVSPLSESDRLALYELQGKDYTARIGKRAQAILLSAQGYPVDQISQILHSHRITVSNWIYQWEDRKIDGLLEREGRGRKRSLTPPEEEQVIQWLEASPQPTKNLLPKIEETFQKTVSLDTVRRLIKRYGKRWKRTRSGPAHSPDEQEYSQCEQERTEHMVAAVEQKIDLLYFDQSGFGREPPIPYAWQDQGVTLVLPSRTGSRINVMGLYSLMQGTLEWEIHTRSITSEDVIDFFDACAERISKPTVIVLDNASIHTSKEIKKNNPSGKKKGCTYTTSLRIRLN